jgi:MFS superfamily sulfate permease-like transporter
VLAAINDLGSFDVFIAAVVVAGAIQLALGIAKAGVIGYYFPSSVIKGMLAAIGLILILKQIPHGLGYDKDFEGDESFRQPDHENTFTEITNALEHPHMGALLICGLSLLIIMLWDSKFIKRYKQLNLIPGALVAVVLGTVLNQVFISYFPSISLDNNHLVQIPVTDTPSSLGKLITFPSFAAIHTQGFWITAVTIALVASIETLLSIEAADKLDHYKRVTPPSVELRAQGIGNMVSGLIGGLPITAVIVRSSANVAAGAKTKLSAIAHGGLLLLLAVAIPRVLNLIPLSGLAAVLLFVGYKLAKPSIFKSMYGKGLDQFIPFVITVFAILFTDLLVGIGIGLVFGFYYVLRTNYKSAITFVEHKGNYLLQLNKDVFFMNKAFLMRTLLSIPNNSHVLINAQRARFVDQDIREALDDFITSTAPSKGIHVDTEGLNLFNSKQ